MYTKNLKEKKSPEQDINSNRRKTIKRRLCINIILSLVYEDNVSFQEEGAVSSIYNMNLSLVVSWSFNYENLRFEIKFFLLCHITIYKL